jgi:hypothetical protein
LFLRKVAERTSGHSTDDMTFVALETLPKLVVSNANGLLQVS